MNLIKSFFRRITKDFQHKQLLPLKLLFFVHASTLFVLYPYLTIHMRELGINIEETAIMSAVTPVVAIVMPPVSGMLADKIGNFRILLSLFSALGGATSLLLLLVPVGRITVTYPKELVLGMACSSHDSTDPRFSFTLDQDQPCSPLEPLNPLPIDVKIQSCGFRCAVSAADDVNKAALLNTRLYTVNIEEQLNNISKSYMYEVNEHEMSKEWTMEDQRNHRKMLLDKHYTTSVRPMSRNSYYFPTANLYNFNCENNDSAINCAFDSKQIMNRFTQGPFKTQVVLSQMEEYSKENVRKYSVNGIYDSLNGSSEVTPLYCENNYDKDVKRISIVAQFIHPDKPASVMRELDLEGCIPQCIVTTTRKEMCSNFQSVVEIDPKLTFWAYLAVRVFIGMIGGTAFAMFEGAVIAILREQKGDYGLQRIYATIGGMISSPLSGMLIDYASQGKGYTDFRPAFYLYAGLKIASGALMLTMNLEFKSPATNVVSDVLTVLKNIEIVALFIACFVMGTAWGYIESFLFWLLQDLGGSRSLMGITITVGGIAGIPLLVMSGPIIHRIGHANVIFIGFIFYAIRLLGYSLIYNPWLCLIFEAMESVTSSLSFTAAVTYAAKMSTPTTDTSIQGMLGGLYFGVGKGAGSLIGGYLMKAFGTRPTYQIFSAVTAITGCIYFLFNRFYLSKRPQVEGNEICKKKPKKQPVCLDLTEKGQIKALENGFSNNVDNNLNIDKPDCDEKNNDKKNASDNLGYQVTEVDEKAKESEVNTAISELPKVASVDKLRGEENLACDVEDEVLPREIIKNDEVRHRHNLEEHKRDIS